jgi:hypothetical protein
MSLSDHYDEYPEAPEQPWAPRVEFDGNTGFIETGPIPVGVDIPEVTEKILRDIGYDPTTMHLGRTLRASHWQQRSAVLDADGKKTGEFETAWLHAVKVEIETRGISVDLPALYAEMSRKPPPRVHHPTAETTVVVCWADVQTGKVDHLGGLKELLDRLEQKRVALEDYLSRAKFDHIVVADCGDIIEGFDNFPAQSRTNCLSLQDQIGVASTEFWKTIKLCTRYAAVDVLSIPSNHCAWRRAGKALAGKVTDDWGLAISKELERRNEDASLPITFHRPPDWQETLQFDLRGTRLGMAHGHQVNNPDQIKTWWAKMTHAGVLDCHILLTGHFHFASLRPVGKEHTSGRTRWHIQAPTLDNGSSWVRNKYGEDGDPALAVFQITPEGLDVSGFALL